MKVVGTKLDNSDYERFETFCLDEGISKSEVLRDLVKQYCNACEDDLQSSPTDKKPIVTIVEDKSIPKMAKVRIVYD